MQTAADRLLRSVDQQPVFPPKPGQNDMNELLSKQMDAFTEESRKTTTKLAYNGRIQEYKEFCAYKYRNDEPAVAEQVTHEKAYDFMFDVALIKNRNTKGVKAKMRHMEGHSVFDFGAYEHTMKVHKDFYDKKRPISQFPEPTKPLGFDSFNTYRSALWNVHQRQVDKQLNGTPWEMIWKDKCRVLEKHVKLRRERVRKNNYEEKLDAQFLPYTLVKEIGNIEVSLFNASREGGVDSALGYGRHRALFLQTKSGILRGESVFKAELSDFLGLKVHHAKDHHEIFVLVMQIATGKCLSVFSK
jgi:hypothetical protein